MTAPPTSADRPGKGNHWPTRRSALLAPLVLAGVTALSGPADAASRRRVECLADLRAGSRR